MFANVGTGAFITTAIFVVILVVGRFAIQSYGQRIGANEMDFEYRPELERERSLYQTLKKGYTVATVLVGLWIIVLGIRLIAGAQADLFEARRFGHGLTSGRMLGALGAAVLLAGVGVMFVPQTLRWDSRPVPILDPRPAVKIRSTLAKASQSGADFSVLTDSIGHNAYDERRPAVRWYNAHPAILWFMLASTGMIFACYFALFIVGLPGRYP